MTLCNDYDSGVAIIQLYIRYFTCNDYRITDFGRVPAFFCGIEYRKHIVDMILDKKIIGTYNILSTHDNYYNIMIYDK